MNVVIIVLYYNCAVTISKILFNNLCSIFSASGILLLFLTNLIIKMNNNRRINCLKATSSAQPSLSLASRPHLLLCIFADVRDTLITTGCYHNGFVALKIGYYFKLLHNAFFITGSCAPSI